MGTQKRCIRGLLKIVTNGTAIPVNEITNDNKGKLKNCILSNNNCSNNIVFCLLY